MNLVQNVTKLNLENGLTVLVKESHKAPVVAIYTFVKAGYFNEPDSKIGISHLIEHMFFKGTQRRGVGEIANETKFLGGFLNASTIYDYTSYYTVLPSSNFSQGLDIQADALMNSVFDPAEIKKEIEVIIQEAKRKLDNPSAFSTEKLFELAFEKHRMRRWRIGTEQGLRSLKRDDLVAFYQNHYRPANIIIGVVGDVNAKQAIAEIERKYGAFEKGHLNKEESPKEPPQNRFKYGFLKGDIQQPYLKIGFHTPGFFHQDTYALEILSIILGYGRSSRLFQKIKEDRGLVHSISSYDYALKDLGMFVFNAITKPESIRQAENAIFEEIGLLLGEPVTEEELSKAKKLLESTYVFSTESVSGQANMLVSYEAMGSYRLAETYLNRLYAVQPGDIQRVVTEYLMPTNCALLEYFPENTALNPVDPFNLEESFRKQFRVPDLIEDLPKPKKANAQSVPVLLSLANEKIVSRLSLANGLTLLVHERSDVPIVSVGIFAKGGRVEENAGIAGITGLLTRVLMKGTRNRSASEIATQIENLGTSVSLFNNPDYISCTMSILSKNLIDGWDILTDILTEPVFPPEEVNKEKENTIAQIQRSKDDMFQYPLQLFYSALFENHAYGLPANGEIESVKSFMDSNLQEWHLRHFKGGNLVVCVVGDVDSKQIKGLINKKLGFETAPQTGSIGTPVKIPIKQVSRIESRDKNQTAMVLGFRAPPFGHKDFYPLLVLQNLISGLGGRFFEELRGRQNLAYTVSGHLVSRFNAGAFLAYIATSPENEERAKSGLLKEFEKLQQKPVSEKELRRSIQYTIGTHQIGLETYGSQMLQYAHCELSGQGFKEVERFDRKVRKVTSEDIHRAVRKYFDLDNYAIGMVRGRVK